MLVFCHQSILWLDAVTIYLPYQFSLPNFCTWQEVVNYANLFYSSCKRCRPNNLNKVCLSSWKTRFSHFEAFLHESATISCPYLSWHEFRCISNSPSHSCVGLKKSLKIDVLKGVKNRLATITIVQDRSDPPRAVWKISSHIAHSSARRAFWQKCHSKYGVTYQHVNILHFDGLEFDPNWADLLG